MATPGTTGRRVKPSAQGSTLVDHDNSDAPAKLGAQVARRIEEDIVAAGWPVGRVLGSEAELLERYGVSRAVFREAVRLVEHHQVATMRRGPGGGLVVTPPDMSAVQEALALYLEYARATTDDVFQVRRILEPMAAGLAAARMSEDGVTRLRKELDDEAALSGPATGELTWLSSFLRTVSELSGNSVLHVFVGALVEYSTRRFLARGAHRRGLADAFDEVRTSHAKIAEVLVSADPARARQTMLDHLDITRRQMRRRLVKARSDGDAENPLRFESRLPGEKLAERTARELVRDIADRGWPVGEVLGSETALVADLGVSRAVFREAVRLLEHHKVVTMRRGPGGGLVITAPDASAVTEMVALFLEYVGVDAEGMGEVRNALELGSIDLAAERLDEDGLQRLKAALALGTQAAPDEFHLVSHALHVELAELSGNPILALFVDILTTLTDRHTRSRPPEFAGVPNDELMADVNRAHAAIVEAVVAGDVALALHRMARHLQAVSPWII